MSIYVGEKKAVICKGDFEPAALYKGETKIAGYTEHEYQGTEIAAENTYRAELGLHVYGRSEQETTTGVNLVDALNSKKWKETGWGGTGVKYLEIEDEVITLTTKNGWRNYTQILDDTLINTTLFYRFEARIASEYENFKDFCVHGDGQNSYPSGYKRLKLTEEWKEYSGKVVVTNTTAGFGLMVNVTTENIGLTTSAEVRKLIVATSEISDYEPYTGGIPSPNPDYPQPISSIGDSGSVDVVVSDNNGNSQILTINTLNGLCGIPVDTGGNYTDSTGQQWICDEVDFERGVYVQRIGKELINRVNAPVNALEKTKELQCITQNIYRRMTKSPMLSDKYKKYSGSTWNHDVLYDFSVGGSNNKYITFRVPLSMTKDEFLANPPTIYGILAEPIETPLTAAELAAYKAIKSYPHYTHIESQAELKVKLKEY